MMQERDKLKILFKLVGLLIFYSHIILVILYIINGLILSSHQKNDATDKIQFS